MENRGDEHNDELLDRATEALRRVPVPEGPPPEAVARALDAVLELDVIPLTIVERIKKYGFSKKSEISIALFVVDDTSSK